jgi:cbb3-type cytochrome oxidase maturation protein
MSVIYLLISISIIVAVVFLYAFLRAVKTGQYDDDYTPSVRMLFDDELIKESTNSKTVTQSAVKEPNSKKENIKTKIKTKII